MPPKPPLDPKKRKQRMMLIGAAAVGVLFLLYMRSRSSSSSSSTTDPNAVSQGDLQNAIDQASQIAAQQQAASDAALSGSSMPYSYGGGYTGDGSGGYSGGSTSPGPTVTFNPTINVPTGSNNGQPVQQTSSPAKKPLTTSGAIRAPSGPKKPAAKAGYTIRGLGGGAWEYVPVAVSKPTGKTSQKPPKKRSSGGAGK